MFGINKKAKKQDNSETEQSMKMAEPLCGDSFSLYEESHADAEQQEEEETVFADEHFLNAYQQKAEDYVRWSEEKAREYLHTNRRYKMYRCMISDHKEPKYWSLPKDFIEKVKDLKKTIEDKRYPDDYSAEDYYRNALENLTLEVKEMYDDDVFNVEAHSRDAGFEDINLDSYLDWAFTDIDLEDWKYNDSYGSEFKAICMNDEGEPMCTHTMTINFPEDVYVELLSYAMRDRYSEYDTFNDLVIEKPELARDITFAVKRILEPEDDFLAFAIFMKDIKSEARKLVEKLESAGQGHSFAKMCNSPLSMVAAMVAGHVRRQTESEESENK